MSTTKEWMEGMRKWKEGEEKRRKEKRRKWLKQIGKPNRVIKRGSETYGLWKFPSGEGVLVCLKMKNGYHPDYSETLEKKYIRALFHVLSLKKKT